MKPGPVPIKLLDLESLAAPWTRRQSFAGGQKKGA